MHDTSSSFLEPYRHARGISPPEKRAAGLSTCICATKAAIATARSRLLDAFVGYVYQHDALFHESAIDHTAFIESFDAISFFIFGHFGAAIHASALIQPPPISELLRGCRRLHARKLLMMGFGDAHHFSATLFYQTIPKEKVDAECKTRLIVMRRLRRRQPKLFAFGIFIASRCSLPPLLSRQPKLYISVAQALESIILTRHRRDFCFTATFNSL